MKWIYILTLVLFFGGCDLVESKEEQAKKIEMQKEAFVKKVEESKEIQLQKLSAETQTELALLTSKKELATIEKEKELEKIRMHSELEKQKIILTQEMKKTLFQQKFKDIEQANNMELKRYLIAVLAIFLLVCSFFIFYYFKKKREDKLRSYDDNLKKYFHQKENDARVKIAEKMLESITSGKLDKAQENQLIGAFSGQAGESYQEQLAASSESEIIESDVVKHS